MDKRHKFLIALAEQKYGKGYADKLRKKFQEIEKESDEKKAPAGRTGGYNKKDGGL